MPDSAWVTAGVGAASAVLGGYAKYFYDRRVLDYQLRRQHDQEERNKLRKLISQYQGRILEAGLDWDRRMVQIYDGRYADLDPPDDERLSPEQYYYQSVVFRFYSLLPSRGVSNPKRSTSGRTLPKTRILTCFATRGAFCG